MKCPPTPPYPFTTQPTQSPSLLGHHPPFPVNTNSFCAIENKRTGLKCVTVIPKFYYFDFHLSTHLKRVCPSLCMSIDLPVCTLGACYSDGFAPRGQTPGSNGDLVSLLWPAVPEIIANSLLGQQIFKKVNYSEPCWWSHFFPKFLFVFNSPFLNALTYKNGASPIIYTFSSSFRITCNF